MITAKVVKEVEVFTSYDERKGTIEEFEVEFETIREIEHFLAYHRSYIRSIEFSGSIEADKGRD